MITFLTWKWTPSAGYRSQFTAESVHILKAMVDRHYRQPHRFVCVTDDPKGLDGVETWPLWEDFATLQNPHGSHNPSCYRRLKVFSHEAREWFGERIVSMDLDVVIVGNLEPLFNRPEDFIIWGQTDFPGRQWYNGSLWYLKTGTRTKVWTDFHPNVSPRMAKVNGHRGSDQGWISYVLGPKEATWNQQDGVYSYRVHIKPRGELPPNARLVAFHGHVDPWSYRAQQDAWVRQHYAA